MSFNDILKKLTERAGGVGAIMLDADGEMVASYSRTPSVEMDLIGAHHGIILDIARDAASRTSVSNVRTISISTEKNKLAITALKEGYYLVVALPKSKPLGKARYESGKAVPELEEEMG